MMFWRESLNVYSNRNIGTNERKMQTSTGEENRKMKDELLKKIERREIVAGVVGLGYVGLTLAV